MSFGQGTAIGIGGAAGALGELAKGILAGREFKEQSAERKAALQEQQAKTAQAMSDRFRSQITQTPALAKNKNYLNILSKMGKQYGFDVPLGPDGALDVNAFAPKPSLQSALDTPEKVSQFQALSPEGQQQFAQRYDTAGTPAGFVGKQVLAVTPGETIQAMRGIADQLKALPEGKATIGTLDTMVRAFKQYAPNVDVDAILNADPAVLGKLSADASAHIAWMKAHGLAVSKDAEAQLMNAHTLADFRKWENDHFKRMDSVSEGRLQEDIRKDDQHVAEAQERASEAWARINDARAGKLGANPLAIAKTNMSTIRQVTSSLNQSLASYQRQAKDLRDAGEDVPPVLVDKINALDGQIDHWNNQLQDAQRALPEIENQALRAAGGPEVVPAGGNRGSSQVQHFVDVAKALPKPQRLQAFTQSQAYKSMSATDKAAAVKAIQALP